MLCYCLIPQLERKCTAIFALKACCAVCISLGKCARMKVPGGTRSLARDIALACQLASGVPEKKQR